jgi:hypothetical protein
MIITLKETTPRYYFDHVTSIFATLWKHMDALHFAEPHTIANVLGWIQK